MEVVPVRRMVFEMGFFQVADGHASVNLRAVQVFMS
jgi:hypothetical protein